MPKDSKKPQAELHWSSTNEQQPCFCNDTIYLNVERLKATPETVASMFGVRNPSHVKLEDSNGKELELHNDDVHKSWSVEADQKYEVIVKTATADTDNNEKNKRIVPINQIFETVFRGDEEKIHELSLAFYDRIWHHPDVSKEFRAKFYSLTSSSKIQAYRQFNWFCEVFGGPSLMGTPEERDTNLLPKVMTKHTQSRMSKEYAIAWLQLMNNTLDELYPENAAEVKETLGLYWLHFYAFFPYNDAERAEFRKIVLGD